MFRIRPWRAARIEPVASPRLYQDQDQKAGVLELMAKGLVIVRGAVSSSTSAASGESSPHTQTSPSRAVWALRLEVEAERVPVRVEVDADIRLRLVVRQRRPARLGVGARGLQVVDPDLQVPHHQLLAGPGRPH